MDDELKSSPRASYLGVPEAFQLDQACLVLTDAFGPHVYQVGSSLQRRDYRDVDVRVILPDDEFDRMFPGVTPSGHCSARRSPSTCASSQAACRSTFRSRG